MKIKKGEKEDERQKCEEMQMKGEEAQMIEREKIQILGRSKQIEWDVGSNSHDIILTQDRQD